MNSVATHRENGSARAADAARDTLAKSAQAQGASDETLAHLREEMARLTNALHEARSALERAEQDRDRAHRRAGQDALTGLPNRRGFEPVARQLLRSHQADGQSLALLFVDLDRFKTVNDQCGHAAGDALLRVVAQRLSHSLRRGDLVCRLGGDEFLCLLPRLGEAAPVAAVAAHLARALAAPCRIGPHQLVVTASVGVAVFPRDGRTVASLVRRADAAMYGAKSLGGGVGLAGEPSAAARGVASAATG